MSMAAAAIEAMLLVLFTTAVGMSASSMPCFADIQGAVSFWQRLVAC